jgi:hypothetical protein
MPSIDASEAALEAAKAAHYEEFWLADGSALRAGIHKGCYSLAGENAALTVCEAGLAEQSAEYYTYWTIGYDTLASVCTDED